MLQLTKIYAKVWLFIGFCSIIGRRATLPIVCNPPRRKKTLKMNPDLVLCCYDNACILGLLRIFFKLTLTFLNNKPIE